MWQWTMNWLHCGGIFDDIDISLHECQTLRSCLPSLKRNHCPIMFVIISRLDNRSTSQGGVIFPQLELLKRFFVFYFTSKSRVCREPLLYVAFSYLG